MQASKLCLFATLPIVLINGAEREGTSVAYKLAKLRRRENTIRKNTVWKIQLESSFEQTILVTFYL